MTTPVQACGLIHKLPTETAATSEKPVRVIRVDDGHDFLFRPRSGTVDSAASVAATTLSLKTPDGTRSQYPHHRFSNVSDTLMEDLFSSESDYESDCDFEVPALVGKASTKAPMLIPPLPIAAKVWTEEAAATAGLETPTASFYSKVAGSCPHALEEAVACSILTNNVEPYFEGRNGGYFILSRETGLPIVVFKPMQNELGAPLDRLKDAHLGAKVGIEPGEGAFSEVLAYRLQIAFGKDIGIPPTWYATAACAKFSTTEAVSVRKAGSMQAFVPGCIGLDEATEEQILRIPVPALQMMAVFDMVTANADRTLTNVLLQESASGEIQIIPIDHGCILPREDLSGLVACWRTFPQVKAPLCAAAREFIESLSPHYLLSVLTELESMGLASASKSTMKERIQAHEASIHLLQRGLFKGLRLDEIALFQMDNIPFVNVLSAILHKHKDNDTSERQARIVSDLDSVITTYLAKKSEGMGKDGAFEETVMQEAIMEAARAHDLLRIL